MLYQAEELVELLVQCKAHNYIEFKLVESWCALRQGPGARGQEPRAARSCPCPAACAPGRGPAALSAPAAGCLCARPPRSTAPALTARPRRPSAACSYLYAGGALRPVPASKSDVFRDRSLGIQDKRALMAFLNSAMQAAQGEGPLKVGGRCSALPVPVPGGWCP